MTMKNLLSLASLLLLAAACGGDAPSGDMDAGAAPEAATAEAQPTVRILEPAEGAMITGTSVTVRLDASGVSIVPAGDMTMGTGHHHLYLDADLTEPGVPVPSIPGSIIHMGDASSAYTFEGLTPGQHRIIAVVADGAHFPLQPWVVDTVTFMVH